MLFKLGLFITPCLSVDLFKCSLITMFNHSNWKLAAAESYLMCRLQFHSGKVC